MPLVYDSFNDTLIYQDSSGVRRSLKGTTDAVARELKVFTAAFTPIGVAGAGAAPQQATVPGVLVTDLLVAVIAPSAMSVGVAVALGQIVAADTVPLLFVNTTGGTLTPPAGTYTFIVLR